MDSTGYDLDEWKSQDIRIQERKRVKHMDITAECIQDSALRGGGGSRGVVLWRGSGDGGVRVVEIACRSWSGERLKIS